MGLNFGWKACEVWESYWLSDPDIDGVSEAAKQSWEADGDASHLRPFVKPGGKPTRITFRVLTPDEVRAAMSLLASADSTYEGLARAYLLCFRLGVDFPDLPATIRSPDGVDHQRVVKERGMRMLASEFVASIDAQHPGIVGFYGGKVFEGSFPSAAEKKASLQPSTPTPSSETPSSQASTASEEKAA